MPRLAESVYAAHYDNVLKFASVKGGVSRQQLMEKLNVTRAIADTLVERCNLELDHKDGRTEYFKAPGTTSEAPADATPTVQNRAEPAPALPELPPQVKAAVVVAGPEPTTQKVVAESDEVDDEAALDAEIVDTRNAIKEAAAKAGKALGEWATNQALVDALREKLQQLAFQRVNA